MAAGTKGDQNVQKSKSTKWALLALIGGFAFGGIACSKAPFQAQPENSGVATSTESTGIIGGTNANGSEDFTKTIVSLFNVQQGSLCTASILSDSILVTAAHCVSGPASSLRVIFGLDIRNKDARIIQAVESYTVSPLYPVRQNERLNNGDIAVVRFSGGLPAGYHPAEVLSDMAALQDGATVLLAGYGLAAREVKESSGTLRYVQTTILKAAYSQSEVVVEQRNGKGACHGDSGGPAYVNVGGRWKLFGVTSRGIGDPQDTCGVAAAYTNVPFYGSWITRTAQQLLAAR